MNGLQLPRWRRAGSFPSGTMIGKQLTFHGLFWAVKRGPTAEGTNCGLEKITVNTVHTCTAVADSVVVYDVVVPMMANHCDISKGTELIAN